MGLLVREPMNLITNLCVQAMGQAAASAERGARLPWGLGFCYRMQPQRQPQGPTTEPTAGQGAGLLVESPALKICRTF